METAGEREREREREKCASRTRAYAAVSRGMQAGGILSAMYHFRIDSSAGFCGKPVSSPRTSRSNETSGTYVKIKEIYWKFRATCRHSKIKFETKFCHLHKKNLAFSKLFQST